jgi:hypothetical protein
MRLLSVESGGYCDIVAAVASVGRQVQNGSDVSFHGMTIELSDYS